MVQQMHDSPSGATILSRRRTFSWPMEFLSVVAMRKPMALCCLRIMPSSDRASLGYVLDRYVLNSVAPKTRVTESATVSGDGNLQFSGAGEGLTGGLPAGVLGVCASGTVSHARRA